jgi:ATP/maltotriose-dependent transcriptional regulator MalT
MITAVKEALGRMNDVSMVDPLSDREVEVVELLAIGLSNDAIASALCLSEKTIKQHVANIYTKLDIANARDAGSNARVLVSLWAVRSGLVVVDGQGRI